MACKILKDVKPDLTNKNKNKQVTDYTIMQNKSEQKFNKLKLSLSNDDIFKIPN